MDDGLADTLAELQLKIGELERALRGITEPANDAASPPPAPPPARSVAPGVPGHTPAASGPAAALVAPTASATAPAPYPEPAHQGRIIDETLEQVSEDGGGSAAPTGGPPAPAAGPFTPAGGSRAHGAGPPVSAPAAPSAPAELLRFRERLSRTASELTHEYDELLGRLSYAAMPSAPASTISFARGAPSLDIVDVEGLRDAAVRAFESDPAGTTAYGTSIGYPRLRSWIAEHHGVEPERVLVTNGSMQADAFLFEHLVRSGDEVIVERPTYDRTLLSLRERGARVHAVELQPDGIDVDALERLLSPSGGVRPTLAHIIPNFQNPAGYTLSEEKRRRLLALAGDHGFLVFEDDPYVALRFGEASPPTMLSLNPEHVVYASSFSKTVCPGIRVGYLVGPPELIAAIAKLATNTYISPNMVAQSIVYEFCASGAIERSVETVRAALAERAATLADALRRELPEAQFVAPEGGYFMWVTLPPGTDVSALFEAAAERGVAFVKGTDFMLDGGENALRLAYSGVTPEQIETGVSRLAEAYRSL